jgi:hypothetical protein
MIKRDPAGMFAETATRTAANEIATAFFYLFFIIL